MIHKTLIVVGLFILLPCLQAYSQNCKAFSLNQASVQRVYPGLQDAPVKSEYELFVHLKMKGVELKKAIVGNDTLPIRLSKNNQVVREPLQRNDTVLVRFTASNSMEELYEALDVKLVYSFDGKDFTEVIKQMTQKPAIFLP